MPTKQDALSQMADEWQRFLEVAQRFSHEEQILQGVVGHWSAKDVLIHIAAGDLDVFGNRQARGLEDMGLQFLDCTLEILFAVHRVTS